MAYEYCFKEIVRAPVCVCPFGRDRGRGGNGANRGRNAIQELQKGDSGPDVLALKQRMYYLGYFNSLKNLTNKYNDVMAKRVAQLQKNNGLEATGIATPELQELIFSDECVWVASTPKPTPVPTTAPTPVRPQADPGFRRRQPLLLGHNVQITSLEGKLDESKEKSWRPSVCGSFCDACSDLLASFDLLWTDGDLRNGEPDADNDADIDRAGVCDRRVSG